MTRQQIVERPVSLWAILAALLLPPLGVFIQRGITPAFWISVLLTLVAWLPGAIFALALLLVPEKIPVR